MTPHERKYSNSGERIPFVEFGRQTQEKLGRR
jgi:hypothetical protein